MNDSIADKEKLKLREAILALVEEYAEKYHSEHAPLNTKTEEQLNELPKSVPYAARVFGKEEVVSAVSSSLDFWLTLGKEGAAFESEFANYLGVRKSTLVNSGSSANLIALGALTSSSIDEGRLLKGDEVITCAAGFPTTVGPILQNGLVPVFVDNNPQTGNIDVSMLEEAFDPKKTKAVMIAHTLGNPFDLGAVLNFCKKYDLRLIEDNCDALGSIYEMPQDLAQELGKNGSRGKLDSPAGTLARFTGTWGDVSTQSFYPPHHITMGEGGCVNIVNDLKLKWPLESMRDWGRDCWCPSGEDDTCGKRFSWIFDELPKGYDHKYVYSHIGYNLKPLDIQAAIGRVQIKRLPHFIESRKENWVFLRTAFDELSDYFDFMLPTHAKEWSKETSSFNWDATGCKTDCSWFGFMLNVRADAGFSAQKLGRALAEKNVGNRALFGGNLVKQPAFLQLKNDYPESFREVGALDGANALMSNCLFLGTYPGLSDNQKELMVDEVFKFVKGKNQKTVYYS